MTGQVIEAPCLGCTLALEPGMLTALLLEMPPVTRTNAAATALEVNPLEEDLLDPLLRLLRLLDRPQDIAVLAPLLEREILYRLLCGPRGETLRQLARPDSRLSQISRAIEAIRRRYDQPLRIEELARLAHMSATSFPPAFPGGDGPESTAIPEANPVAGGAPPAAVPGRGRRPGQLRCRLRKSFPVQPGIPPVFREAARPGPATGARRTGQDDARVDGEQVRPVSGRIK